MLLNQWTKFTSVSNHVPQQLNNFLYHWSCPWMCSSHRPSLDSWNANICTISSIAGSFLKPSENTFLSESLHFYDFFSHSHWLKNLAYSQGIRETKSCWTQALSQVQSCRLLMAVLSPNCPNLALSETSRPVPPILTNISRQRSFT